MSTFADYQTPAISNAVAPPDGIRGTDPPSTIDGVIQELMSRCRLFYDATLAGINLWGGTAGGTADALTITPSPAIAAYVAGQTFRFITAAANTSTTPTLNVNAVGTKTIQRLGGALVAGDMPSGATIIVIYDGTYFQLASVNGNEVRKSAVGAFTAQQYFAEATLTDASSIAWDLDAAQSAKVTLGGNRTLANPSNMKAGGTYILRVIQDGTGSRTLSLASAYKKAGGATLTLTTTAAAVDILSFYSDGTYMYLIPSLNFS